MKLTLAGLATLLLLPVCLTAQKEESVPALKAMVETEQAFSKTAAEKNTRDAFIAFIAEDGLLFRPRAVNGKQWLLEHPAPPSDKRPLLAWQPTFAAMAKAGDLGYTTGPWEFKSDIKDEKPSGYGHFVTVWKKQLDGSWKFVVDLGISHPQSGGPLKLWQVAADDDAKPGKPVDVEKTTKILLQRDRSFSAAGLEKGLQSAFLAYAAPDVRLYRNDSLPFVGRPAAVQALTAMKDSVTWQPVGGDVSRSGDLGYTHGTYETSSAGDKKKIIERGNYLRIWKVQDGAWKIVLEVMNPV
jgi:ketosteroid isomerase-like protein